MRFTLARVSLGHLGVGLGRTTLFAVTRFGDRADHRLRPDRFLEIARARRVGIVLVERLRRIVFDLQRGAAALDRVVPICENGR